MYATVLGVKMLLLTQFYMKVWSGTAILEDTKIIS